MSTKKQSAAKKPVAQHQFDDIDLKQSAALAVFKYGDGNIESFEVLRSAVMFLGIYNETKFDPEAHCVHTGSFNAICAMQGRFKLTGRWNPSASEIKWIEEALMVSDHLLRTLSYSEVILIVREIFRRSKSLPPVKHEA